MQHRSSIHTVRNLHFLSKKFNFDNPRKLSNFFGVKTRENLVVLDILAVDNFDFPRKTVDFFYIWNFGDNEGIFLILGHL